MLRAFAPPEVLHHPSMDPFDPADHLLEMQSMLRALADVEMRYEREREHLKSTAEPDMVKQRLLGEVEERRCRDREPYVRRLSELRRHRPAAFGSGLTLAVHSRAPLH